MAKTVKKRVKISAPGFEAEEIITEGKLKTYLKRIKKNFKEDIKVDVTDIPKQRTLYITTRLSTQETIWSEIPTINGRVSVKKRLELIQSFDSGNIMELCATPSLLDGVKFSQDKGEIKVIFLDVKSKDVKKRVLTRV